MGGHQFRRVSCSQQSSALRRTFCIDEGDRDPHKLGFLEQGLGLLPEVAAVRALGIKKHIHRIGAHHGADREALCLGRYIGIGLCRIGCSGSSRRLGRCILLGTTGNGHQQGCGKGQGKFDHFHVEDGLDIEFCLQTGKASPQ